MSLEMVLIDSYYYLVHRYEANWNLENVVIRNKNQSVRSPPFAPIPGISLQFCWEMHSHEHTSSNHKTSNVYLKLILRKLINFDVPELLSMKINVTVLSYDTILEKQNKGPIFIHNMVPLTCIETNFECCSHDLCPFESPNCQYWAIGLNRVRLKSVFNFFGHFISPLIHSRHMRTLKNQEHFMKDFSLIYNSSTLSDMRILVGEKEVHVHKSVLIAHSPVMRKMLEHDYQETKTNTLTIVDTDYEIFDCFLKFLYSGEIEDQRWSTIKQLYILADKYDVQTLQMQCAALFESEISMDNLCETLKLAYDYNGRNGNNELKDKAKQFAVIHFTELVNSSEWKEMALSHPKIGYDIITMVYQP